MGIEACATAHHWARELISLGHNVKLMSPTYVKSYVKRNKNDATDSAAICEAATQPPRRFVPVKNVGQQSVFILHRARFLLIKLRTMLFNALRAHMVEYGIIPTQGLYNIEQLILAISDPKKPVPDLAGHILNLIVEQLREARDRIIIQKYA